jgi:hypothetical protein
MPRRIEVPRRKRLPSIHPTPNSFKTSLLQSGVMSIPALEPALNPR